MQCIEDAEGVSEQSSQEVGDQESAVAHQRAEVCSKEVEGEHVPEYVEEAVVNEEVGDNGPGLFCEVRWLKAKTPEQIVIEGGGYEQHQVDANEKPHCVDVEAAVVPHQLSVVARLLLG